MIEELRQIAEEVQQKAAVGLRKDRDVPALVLAELGILITTWVEKYGPFVEAAEHLGARRQLMFPEGPTTYLDAEHRNFDLAYREAMEVYAQANYRKLKE